MALNVYTSIVGKYSGADALDITHKSATGPGVFFAPSTRLLRLYHPRWGGRPNWQAYQNDYIDELEARIALGRSQVDQVLAMKSVTLLCYCKDVRICHRIVAAEWLVEYGAVYQGERPVGRQPRARRRVPSNLELPLK